MLIIAFQLWLNDDGYCRHSLGGFIASLIVNRQSQIVNPLRPGGSWQPLIFHA
jgi:hypothetical protein